MPQEIEGREISARFRQGQFYIPKFYKDMFDIREGDYFILKVVNRSHASVKKRPNKNFEKKEDKGGPPIPRPDLKIPNMMDDSFPKPMTFNIGNEEEETPWGDYE